MSHSPEECPRPAGAGYYDEDGNLVMVHKDCFCDLPPGAEGAIGLSAVEELKVLQDATLAQVEVTRDAADAYDACPRWRFRKRNRLYGEMMSERDEDAAAR